MFSAVLFIKANKLSINKGLLKQEWCSHMLEHCVVTKNEFYLYVPIWKDFNIYYLKKANCFFFNR